MHSNSSIFYLGFSESPVAVVIPVGPVRVRVGEPINLECQASGEPRPSVSWHRLDTNRRTMLSGPIPMESNVLMQVLAELIITPCIENARGPFIDSVLMFKGT